MKTKSIEKIIYSTDLSLVNEQEYSDCVFHAICTGGEARFSYNDRQFVMSVNDITVIAQPGNVRDLTISEDFKVELVLAPGTFLHTLLPANNYSIVGCVSLFSNPIIPVCSSEAIIFINDLRNIHERIDNLNHPFYNEMIGGLLQTMIYDLFAFHSAKNENVLTTDRVGYITRQFFMLIESGRPKTIREVAYYASQLNVTPKYLLDTIKRTTGYSVSTHINRAATAIIISYLKESNLSLTQIAEEMGFTSLSYFSRYCHKNLGKSPSNYRQSLSAKSLDNKG